MSETLYARFGSGSQVETTSALSVRANPDGDRLGVIGSGATGTVIDGPVDIGGYRWWQIEYDDVATGWSVGYWLAD